MSAIHASKSVSNRQSQFYRAVAPPGNLLDCSRGYRILRPMGKSIFRGLGLLACLLGCWGAVYAASDWKIVDFHTAELEALSPELRYLHEKSAGQIKKLQLRMGDGLIKQAVVLGKPGGLPLYALGGTYTRGLYMKKVATHLGMSLLGYKSGNFSLDQLAAELSAGQLFIVLSEPRGFGASPLVDLHQGEHHRAGLMDMIADFHRATKLVSEINAGARVVSIGHSLGGLVADLAETGVSIDRRGEVFVSRKAQQNLRDHLRLKVLLGSPFAISEQEFAEHMRYLLTQLAPQILEYQESIQRVYRALEKRIPSYNHLAHGSLLVAQELANLNPLLGKLHGKDVIDLRHIYAEDLRTLAMYSTSQSYPPLLIKQYGKIYDQLDLKLPLRDGREFSLKTAYLAMNPDFRIPSLLVTGELDAIARPQDILAHYQLLKQQKIYAEQLIVKGGHLNSALGTQVSRIADKAADMYRFIEMIEAVDARDREQRQKSCRQAL